MKKYLFYLLPTLFAAGCATNLSQEIEPVEPATRAAVSETMADVRARALDRAVYNEVVDAWMIPQNDPYTLENFQAAYDKLSAGKSAQSLSKAQAGEFAAAKKLAPTHLALKIYPRSEEEQWKVEMMEDVSVAYIPFDWVQLPEEEAEKLPQAKDWFQARAKAAGTTTVVGKPAAAFIFAEKSPYTVTYDYTDVTDGGPTGPVTYQLPILYTVWPIDKPLPDDLEYVVDYEVFLPRAASESFEEDALLILVNEAVAATYGTAPLLSRNDPLPLEFEIIGDVSTFDNTLGINVPMANLRVRYQSGSYIGLVHTDRNGHFWMTPYWYGSPSLAFVYQDPQARWKITTGGSTVPYSVPVDINWSNGFSHKQHTLTSSAYQENEIHRAVNYFYNVQNTFPKPPATASLGIYAHSSNGRANYSNPYYSLEGGNIIESYHVINMFNTGSSDYSIIGTALHEIGHFFHDANNLSHYSATDGFLRESFACYAGWYLAQRYYESIGWTNPGGNPPIGSGHSRQWWYKTNGSYTTPWGRKVYNGWYSPLFVDLTDDFNQKESHAGWTYPDDQIKGVPASTIWSIITTSTDYWTARGKILNLVNSDNTLAEFNEWIQDFDEWANNYPLD
jgi:hypothetical protein